MKHRVSLALALGLAACGDPGGSTDVEPTLRFADRTDAEIIRLINAAGGTEMFRAEAVMGQFDDSASDPDPCPAITIEGQTATVIGGGCTTRDGDVVNGWFSVDNPIGFDQIDWSFGDATAYTAHDFSVGDGGPGALVFSGTLVRTDQFATWDADLTVTDGTGALRSDLYYHCTNPDNPRCTVSGSGLELIGVGGALVSGQVVIDRSANRQTASFTLRGVDRVEVSIADNCVAWSLVGTDRGVTCP